MPEEPRAFCHRLFGSGSEVMLVDVDHNDSDDRLAVMLLACQASEGQGSGIDLGVSLFALVAPDEILLHSLAEDSPEIATCGRNRRILTTPIACKADPLSVAGVKTESA